MDTNCLCGTKFRHIRETCVKFIANSLCIVCPTCNTVYPIISIDEIDSLIKMNRVLESFGSNEVKNAKKKTS